MNMTPGKRSVPEIIRHLRGRLSDETSLSYLDEIYERLNADEERRTLVDEAFEHLAEGRTEEAQIALLTTYAPSDGVWVAPRETVEQITHERAQQDRSLSEEERILRSLIRVAHALAEGDEAAADAAMSEIKFKSPGERVPGAPKLKTKLDVWRRDSFTCRHCGIRTIPSQVMQTISALRCAAGDFPFNGGANPRVAHAAYLLLMSSVDHLKPSGHGGPHDAENLVTACWPCNLVRKNKALPEVPPEVPPSDWDGLTGLYPELWRRVQELPEECWRPKPWTTLLRDP